MNKTRSQNKILFILQNIFRMKLMEITKKRSKFISKYQMQLNKIYSIWTDNSIFGIEKWCLRILPWFRFISLSFIIACIVDFVRIKWFKNKSHASALFIDIYIILKIMLLLFFLFYQGLFINYNLFITIISIYFLLETITILLEIFLATDYTLTPISKKRSILTLFINYQESVLCFAIIYLYNAIIDGVNCGQQALYFSYSVAMTLGFGDFNAKNDWIGQAFVIIQLIITSLLVFILFSYFLTEYGQRKKRV